MKTFKVAKLVLAGLITAFSSTVMSAPAAPTLYKPDAGATVNANTTVNFSWYKTGSNSTYRIVISQDSSFSGFVDNGGSSYCRNNTCWTGTTSSLTIPKSLSCSGHTYYWKVRANDYTGASGWSNSNQGRTIKTAGSTDSCPATSPIAAKVDNFVNQSNGKCIDFDGYYGCQCVDLVRQYARDVLGTVLGSGNAYDIFNTTSSSKFTKIYNTPSAIPQKGDIIVWNKSSSNGYYGHISLFISGDAYSFKSLDQNWINPPNFTKGSPAAIITHYYTTSGGVAGWLRPK